MYMIYIYKHKYIIIRMFICSSYAKNSKCGCQRVKKGFLEARPFEHSLNLRASACNSSRMLHKIDTKCHLVSHVRNKN